MITVCPNKKDEYWVYSLRNKSNEVLYLGVNRIKDIFSFNELNYRPEFDTNQEYKIELLESVPSKTQAMQIMQNYFVMYGTPVFNRPVRKVLKCLTTGEIFYNAAEACRHYDIAQSNMTHHLHKAPGFNKLRGLEFAYEVQSC